jgi:hypothetical protein
MPQAHVIRHDNSFTIQFEGFDPTPLQKPLTKDDPTWAPGQLDALFEVDLGKKVQIKKMICFVGTNKDNAYEASIDVYDEKGNPRFQVSLHKEASGVYDAWMPPGGKSVDFKTRYMEINLHAFNTHDTMPGQVHFELKLELA